MIRAHPFKRPEPWLLSATLSFVAGCELVAGLTGDRHYEPPSDGGRHSADNADSSQAGSASGGFRGDGGTKNEGARANVDASVKDAASGGAGGASSVDGRARMVDSGKSDAQRSDATLPSSTPDAGASPPSCKGMKGNECGDHEDCCATLPVLGGMFPMGRGNGSDAYSGSGTEVPEHTVTLSPFFLDEFEVTVGRFRRYFEAYDGKHPPADMAGVTANVPGSGWQSAWDQYLQPDQRSLDSALAGNNFSTWTTTPSAGENLPITFVTWFEAFAFCIWDGGRLPTEAEWEFAAAGGEKNRLYPWGSENPESNANLAVLDCSAGGTPEQCTLTDILQVGSRPDGAGWFGQMDLAGSMQEPVLDVWDGTFYTSSLAIGVNVANLDPSEQGLRVMRGGNFQQSGSQVRAAARVGINPAARAYTLGIRCARNPMVDATGKAL